MGCEKNCNEKKINQLQSTQHHHLRHKTVLTRKKKSHPVGWHFVNPYFK